MGWVQKCSSKTLIQRLSMIFFLVWILYEKIESNQSLISQREWYRRSPSGTSSRIWSSDLTQDLLNVVSLYWDIFRERIEEVPRAPLLALRVELNHYSPLIQKPCVVGRVLEEIMTRLIQQYMLMLFSILDELLNMFLLISRGKTYKKRRRDDTKVKLTKSLWWHKGTEDHCTFRLVLDSQKLNKKVERERL